MLSLLGHRIKYEDQELTKEAFRTRHLVPICGEQKSHRVLQGIIYMSYAYCESDTAKTRLERVNESGTYLEYTDFGVFIQFQCSYFDKVCTITVLQCQRYSSRLQ